MSHARLILGIDEAGRGPVIGPMVVCGYLIKESKSVALKRIGVRDSKELSIHNMLAMLPHLEYLAEDIFYRDVQPKEIDGANLGEICVQTFAGLINSSGAEVVYLDVPAARKNVQKYLNKLRKRVLSDVEINGSIKADSIYPCVSAASICAKVRREKLLAELKERYGEFGSGYPGDPRTVEFLKKFCSDSNLPEIVRKKWQTIKRIRFFDKQSGLKF